MNRHPCAASSAEEQKRLAEASKAKWKREKPFNQAIVTPIVKAAEFWPAEDYHQDYYLKNPARYKFYVNGCGRYARGKAGRALGET